MTGPLLFGALTLSALVAVAATVPGDGDVDRLRAAAVAAIARARATAQKSGSVVAREVTLPSIERLVEDADLRRASPTVPQRDEAFVRETLKTARAYADRVAAGQDPYRTATGRMVKAYRADWDGTLQPYALYVPRDYDARKAWPLVVALHGAYSNPLNNLRRVFGLNNRPGESDDEAARNLLPLPDVPALVVCPSGRGGLMGYDGLGGEDVMRVIADVRRAYNIDPERMTLTGLSMGGGATWAIGLRHPEMFAALAPICGMTDFRPWIPAGDEALYDLPRLEQMSPLAIAENAAHMQVMIFHGADDPTVPVQNSRRMAERYRALGWLGKNVTYTEYPGVHHDAWALAYKDAALLRRLIGIRRDPAAPRTPLSPPPPGEAIPGLFGKSLPRQHPHIYVYGTHGSPEAVAAARALALALADWGPMVDAKFTVKADRDVTPDDLARFKLVLIGAPPLNELAPSLLGEPELGDDAYRANMADLRHPGHESLTFGALTPRGFERLRRFAVPNRDHFAPESNLMFVRFH
ncbi:MAG TPA: prolyl oligopeptidase family serine peptidase [Polyangia bacterium]|nr:prolyl oligopeptidase family serine peptidase [Polyangia bacterium]